MARLGIRRTRERRVIERKHRHQTVFVGEGEVVGKYRHGLHIMKGGLTISGGEPLMQHRFVLKLFAAAKQMGVHTTLDSNGYLGDRLSDADLPSIDLVLLDLKAMTPDLHKRLTGVDNQPVHVFARRLAAARRPIWVRFVLVPGWTDDLAEVDRIAAFAAGLGNVERVDVLPFHQMGRFKWEKLNMDYQLKNTQPPSRELYEKVSASLNLGATPPAGLIVANGRNFGKFLFGGAVFGKVDVEGSMNLFYAGWLLTGARRDAVTQRLRLAGCR